jgi:hypothetical protein
MKALSVTIKNCGLIENETIEFNKPLICVYGDIKNGKTTVLESIKIGFGVKVPDGFIREGQDRADIIIELENGSIERCLKRRYKDVDGVKSPDGTLIDTMKIVIGGKILGKKDLAKHVNPFQLNQNHFVDMKLEERIKFFIELFGLDTSAIDESIKKIEEFNSSTRSFIQGFGAIELKVVEKPNIESMKVRKENIKVSRDTMKKEYDESFEAYEQSIADSTGLSNDLSALEEKKTSEDKAHVDFLKKLKDDYDESVNKATEQHEAVVEEVAGKTVTVKEMIEKFVPVECPVEPTLPSLDEIDLQLQNAQADVVRFENYEKELLRSKQKEAKEKLLADGVAALKKKREEKKELLNSAKVSEKIEGLDFDEKGKLTFEGSTLAMISDSQEMKLSSLISALYPNSFSIELLDRCESMGKSVFELSDKAIKDGRNILCTIVRDEPAEAPEEVGVFVMEKGTLEKIQ